jgi:hypothetical protein
MVDPIKKSGHGMSGSLNSGRMEAMMKQLIWLVIGMTLAFTFDARASQPGPDSLDACKRMRAQIERYDALRRHGGSTTQMESWRKSRANQEEKFRSARCKKYGKAVRKAD